jgi:hypothetical protein
MKPRLPVLAIIVVALSAAAVGYAAFRRAEPVDGTPAWDWREMAWQVASQEVAWQEVAWQKVAWQKVAWQKVAWQKVAWQEVAWRFPVDQWGTGKAFSCRRADCGHEVSLYLRAKLGSCDCTRGVADDDDLDRMSDFDLLGSEISPLAPGRPIKVGIMKGRVRAYALTASGEQARNVISVVVNDRCDMIVATSVLPRGRLEKVEPAVIEFLNSPAVLHWAEAAIGL